VANSIAGKIADERWSKLRQLRSQLSAAWPHGLARAARPVLPGGRSYNLSCEARHLPATIRWLSATLAEMA
jgi:hypothetical protein